MKVGGFFIELNLRRKKWHLCCSCNPNSQISYRIKETGKDLDVLTWKYGNIILVSDFNAEPADTIVSDFCEIYNLKNIIREKTCFKNPNNSSCIDLIITNVSKSFQNSTVIDTGLSDFYKMCILHSWKCTNNFYYHYRKFKDFNNDSFIKDFETLLTQSFNEEAIPLQALRESMNVTLEKHPPATKRYGRANQAPYWANQSP